MKPDHTLLAVGVAVYAFVLLIVVPVVLSLIGRVE